jgi:hypothetical protein
MAFPLFVVVSLSIAAATAGAATLYARQRSVAIVAALAGAFGLLLFHAFAYFHYYADDAYIALRYSRHLADGVGPVWNPGQHVEGYTSFSWMAVLAGMAKAGFDLVFASQLLALLAILATFLLVARLWSLWADDEPESGIGHPLVLAAALLALALGDAVPFWGLSGMETPLFMALLTASAVLYLQEHRRGGFPFSALALAATAMTRPEGMIAAAVTGVFVAYDAWRDPNRARSFARAALWGALFFVPFAAWFGWRWSYYGYLFPNTFYAKVGATSDIFNRGLEYINTFGIRYQLLFMVAGAAVLFTTRRLRTDAAYIIALCGGLMLGIVFEGGDDFPNGRFMAPMLPLLYLGGLAGFAVVLRSLTLERLQRALVVVTVFTLGALALLPGSITPGLDRERQAHDDRRILGEWLNERTPDDYTIAAFAVGAIGYYADDRNILDLLGLNDETIAHTHVPHLGRGIAGHEKYNVDYVFDIVKPQIIIPSDAEAGPVTTEELKKAAQNRSPVPGRDLTLTDSRLWANYEVRSLSLEGRWFNILVRTDVIDQLQLPAPP